MKLYTIVTALLITIFSLIITCSCTKKEGNLLLLNGRWVGEFSSLPYPDLMSLRIDSFSYQLNVYYGQVTDYPIEHITYDGENISFEIAHEKLQGKFTGKVTNNIIEGEVETIERKVAVRLIKVANTSLEETSNKTGFYKLSGGEIIKIMPFFLDQDVTPLSLLDLQTGIQRVAFPIGKGSYQAGNRMLNPAIAKIFVNFPDSTKIILRNENAKKEGTRLPDILNTKDITIKNGQISLEGTLTFSVNPTTDQSATTPLVIFVAGSGEQLRGTIIDDYIQALPYKGIATFIYDKRGCGESTGDYTNASFDDLASDLVAVVNALQKEKSINRDKIALIGIDQAGYIMPLAAEKLPNKLRCIISLSGTTDNMQNSELYACASRMSADGFLTPEIVAATQYQQAMFDFLANKTDSSAFQKVFEASKDAVWINYVTPFDKKEYINLWRKTYLFSPENSLQKINIPFLAIYGENDILINVPKNTEILKKYIPTAEIKILPKANHLLLLGENRGDIQFSEIEGYAPEMFPTIYNFLEKNLVN